MQKGLGFDGSFSNAAGEAGMKRSVASGWATYGWLLVLLDGREESRDEEWRDNFLLW